MSYSIYIGEAVIATKGDDELSVVVERMVHADAPVLPYDSMTGNSNGRHPGYAAWADWSSDVGLYDLFFNGTNGIMREHPGAFTLTAKHHDAILGALTRWREAHPGTTPGFGSLDHRLARLMWLEWWVGWAIEHCQRPAIYNT